MKWFSLWKYSWRWNQKSDSLTQWVSDKVTYWLGQLKIPFLLGIDRITPQPSCMPIWATLSLLKMCHNQFWQGIPQFDGKVFLGSLPLVTNQLITIIITIVILITVTTISQTSHAMNLSTVHRNPGMQLHDCKELPPVEKPAGIWFSWQRLTKCLRSNKMSERKAQLPPSKNKHKI